MKHYSTDYLLATCTDCFDEKLIRFFTINGMIDVCVENNKSDPFELALLKNVHYGFDSDDFSKTVWHICDYVVKHIKNGGTSENFIDVPLSSSKIEVIKLDYYTVKATVRLTGNNLSSTRSITLDTYNNWFLLKLICWASSTIDRRMLSV